MNNDSLLSMFAWFFIITIFCLMVVPYIRGRADLITARNLFLLGSINFIGFSSLACAYGGNHYQQYSSREYGLYIFGNILFFSVFIVAYRYMKYPRMAAGRHLRKWPPLSRQVLFAVQVMVILFAVFYRYLPQIPVLTQIVHLISDKMLPIAVVLAFAAWHRKKGNVVTLGIFLVVLGLGLLLSILAGFGRRPLLCALLAVPLSFYWLEYRYKTVRRTLLIGGVSATALLVALASWSTLRGFDAGAVKKERNIQNTLEAIRKIPGRVRELEAKKIYGLMGQNAAECSLLSIQMYSRPSKQKPFNSVLFVLSNPIPRTAWPSKPLSLGYTLPHDYFGTKVAVNWGPGLVGHAFHEGGLHMLIFYAIIAAVFLRYFDEILVRQHNNPYVLALFAALSGHIIGWSRGDIGTFSMQIISSFIAVLLVGYTCRLFFGTDIVYPRTDSRQYLELASMQPMRS